ncbi:DUF6779 domain-containing protein [Corynebacterium lowii]|uniref:DUF6779 domain-containing protein n=1 Tax=Corynebacterium lowii TaxID=1544413 RepID=A0A0Q0UIY4_9CORY|nr:DUF6779 domain-containing protein [Corynebacterium lowii]KQB86193.1 hypothetical protein Clow_01547 [Corynebacterium lowii]MDP9852667.1 hypothetical protein [Corynebacterium lowii]
MSTPQSDRRQEPTTRRAASHGAGKRRQHGGGEGSGTDGGQILLVVLVVLALAASVVMQLTDSNAALKIALLAALWASIIGFFLVSRYRRQVQRSREQLAYEQRLHRSEMREAQARAEAAGAQNQQPRTGGGLSEEDVALLSEIRAGLDEVRSQLEDLQGRAFEYEPAALRAQAWRLQELEERTESVEAPEKTGHIAGAPSLDAVAGRLGQSERGAESPRSISPELAHLLESEEGHHRGSHRADDRWEQAEPAAASTPSVEDTAEIAAVAPEVPEPVEQEAPAPRRGRRRADEHSTGLSVAELMENMKKGTR